MSDLGQAPTGKGPPKGQPERLGKYEIVERLGQGAMGVVYKAHDPLLERDVALKVMLPKVAEDPEGKLRFEREAKAIARMVHPHVVTVFDLGYHTDGSPYIAMELLHGQDLQHALRQSTLLTLGRKIAIVLQVLDGLGRAHAAGIVHRDIKPANVFLTEDGNVKIMDFGVAFTKSKETSTGVAVGTPDYMSPEQVSGARVDERSDLYSVGAMLCELVSGRRPFHGETLVSILYKIAHEEPRVELPEGSEYEALGPILKKALLREVEERYQTAAEFGDALEAYVRTLPAESAAAAAQPSVDVGSQETIAISLLPTAPVAEPRPGDKAADEPILLSLDFTATPYLPEPPAPPADPSPVFKTMREIYSRKQTGHLRFTHGKAHRSLRFMEGQVIHAMSDVDGERLGDVLVRYGKLTQDVLERAKPIVLGKKRRLGPVLLENAFLDRGALDEGVGLHAREILFESAARGGGSLSFEESPPGESATEDAASNLSTVELILEAARRVADPAVVRNVLGDLDRTLLKDEAAFRRLTNITFTPADGFLAAQIDGSTSARDVFKLIPLPTENVERSLFSLLCTGVVEYRAPVVRSAQTIRLPAPPPPAPVVRPAPATPMAAPPVVAKPVVAKPPHPTDGSGAGRDLEKERQRVESTGRTIEESRRLIVDAYEGLDRKDHFELLGIARTANDVEVKEAYFRMAKSFHPDTRLDPSLSDVADMREAVFIRLGAAYEKLRSRESRRSYAENLPPVVTKPREFRGGAVDEQEARTEVAHVSWVALETLRMAEMKLRVGLVSEAIALAQAAFPNLEGRDRMRAQVLIARAMGRNTKFVKDAEKSLLEVVKEHPQAHEPLVALGDIYRSSQMSSRAVAMYRKALELDPENHHVRTAIRDLGGLDPGAGGLLKKIFKKN